MKLGNKQLELLVTLASPSRLMVVGDKVSHSLIKRGLLAPHIKKRPNGWHRITPAGLRALADAFEAGLLKQFMHKFPPAKKPHR